jgi:hypothetical protein
MQASDWPANAGLRTFNASAALAGSFAANGKADRWIVHGRDFAQIDDAMQHSRAI